MTEVFRIPYPKTAAQRKQWTRRYGMNAYYAGKHWAQRKQDADYWHLLTRTQMNMQNVRREPFEGPVVVTFCWNDRLDIDNHAVMGKLIVDAMRGRVIRDDNRRYLRGVSKFFHSDDCIKVTVTEVQCAE